MEFKNKSVFELKELLEKKTVTSVEMTKYFLDRIESLDQDLNAYIQVSDKALDEAKKADDKIQAGEKGRLLGVPVGIKDLLCTRGIQTTAASKMLEGFVPPYSATVVEKLQSEGAVVLGKLNLDEFAMGSSNENSYFGAVKNPWNKEYVSGGSSGGSAAAVAAGLAPVTIGTDTGGSIRQPASFCGVVGMKPTYGRVSRYGIVAFASSLDQAGPLSRTVKDAALISEVISGFDENDSTTSERSVPQWSASINESLKGKKVGLVKEYFESKLHESVQEQMDRAIEFVKEAGAEVVEVSLSLSRLAIPVYYMVATSEASSNLARYDGVRYGYRSNFDEKPASSLDDFYERNRGEGFGSEVKRRIMLGTYALSSGYYDAYYKKAGQIRRLLAEQFQKAFEKCDVLMGPVTATPAFKLGDRISDPLEMYLNDIFTTSANLVGIPGMSVPMGFSKEGLPVGVQLMSSSFSEQVLFDVGSALEQRADIWKGLPNGY
ncbi:MAG: Asp-tRNA(Asn)/Glu-tRNA(Gln) amidotransferase GatCAB subunit A [Bdellovibrionaceae bacterium]|nr:Asp-tRNA(Asn)/Glu-tRNA(Gln) amidotransferase GatCAB subunit A [Pseudobdellovibrionaceae bacterium]|tara:strand:- start:1062 stop:2531 length:1470 start_codon:yes stop_codon:yes gene_type:complete